MKGSQAACENAKKKYADGSVCTLSKVSFDKYTAAGYISTPIPHRVDLINTVNRGGIDRVSCHNKDVQSLDFEKDTFDTVTALEVLEHLPDPGRAVRELCRVGKEWLLVSVPSKPDNNPEHINLFSADDLEQLLLENGARSVQMHHVLNHRIALAKIDAANS